MLICWSIPTSIAGSPQFGLVLLTNALTATNHFTSLVKIYSMISENVNLHSIIVIYRFIPTHHDPSMVGCFHIPNLSSMKLTRSQFFLIYAEEKNQPLYCSKSMIFSISHTAYLQFKIAMDNSQFIDDLPIEHMHIDMI